MYLHDFQNAMLAGGVSHAPGTALSADGTSNGSAVDLKNGDGAVHVLAMLGNIDNWDPLTVTLKVQESANGSTGWTDIGTKTTTPGSTARATIENSAFRLSVPNRAERYVRAVLTVSGTEASGSQVIELASYVFSQMRHNGAD